MEEEETEQHSYVLAGNRPTRRSAQLLDEPSADGLPPSIVFKLPPAIGPPPAGSLLPTRSAPPMLAAKMPAIGGTRPSLAGGPSWGPGVSSSFDRGLQAYHYGAPASSRSVDLPAGALRATGGGPSHASTFGVHAPPPLPAPPPHLMAELAAHCQSLEAELRAVTAEYRDLEKAVRGSTTRGDPLEPNIRRLSEEARALAAALKAEKEKTRVAEAGRRAALDLASSLQARLVAAAASGRTSAHRTTEPEFPPPPERDPSVIDAELAARDATISALQRANYGLQRAAEVQHARRVAADKAVRRALVAQEERATSLESDVTTLSSELRAAAAATDALRLRLKLKAAAAGAVGAGMPPYPPRLDPLVPSAKHAAAAEAGVPIIAPVTAASIAAGAATTGLAPVKPSPPSPWGATLAKSVAAAAEMRRTSARAYAASVRTAGHGLHPPTKRAAGGRGGGGNSGSRAAVEASQSSQAMPPSPPESNVMVLIVVAPETAPPQVPPPPPVLPLAQPVAHDAHGEAEAGEGRESDAAGEGQEMDAWSARGGHSHDQGAHDPAPDPGVDDTGGGRWATGDAPGSDPVAAVKPDDTAPFLGTEGDDTGLIQDDDGDEPAAYWDDDFEQAAEASPEGHDQQATTSGGHGHSAGPSDDAASVADEDPGAVAGSDWLEAASFRYQPPAARHALVAVAAPDPAPEPRPRLIPPHYLAPVGRDDQMLGEGTLAEAE